MLRPCRPEEWLCRSGPPECAGLRISGASAKLSEDARTLWPCPDPDIGDRRIITIMPPASLTPRQGRRDLHLRGHAAGILRREARSCLGGRSGDLNQSPPHRATNKAILPQLAKRGLHLFDADHIHRDEAVIRALAALVFVFRHHQTRPRRHGFRADLDGSRQGSELGRPAPDPEGCRRSRRSGPCIECDGFQARSVEICSRP